MKSKRCALGLVAMFAAVSGLTACNAATASDSGAVFTYTDAQGNRVSYSAEDLLNDYRKTGTSLSTEFDKIYEVLVRHYYDTVGGTTLDNLKAKATADVVKDKQTASTNASSNKTSYETEWEKILDNNSCENVDDLYQYHLYQEEKTDFQNNIYLTFGTNDTNLNGLEVMRDGGQYTYEADGQKVTKTAFGASDKWGIGDEGWIKEQMPYHTRHILLKFSSAKANEFTRDVIGESTTTGEGGETTKLASVVLQLAGAKVPDENDKTLVSLGANRWDFEDLAKKYSDDTTSAAEFGDNGIMTKVMSSDLIHEYKLGIYAFDSLYNQETAATDWGAANAYRVMPGLTETATSAADVDPNQKLTDKNVTVNQFFKDEGIGTIPFGAALALFDNRDVIKDVNGNVVNEDNAAFYPRNIIFNKYFNKHNICVITPNAIQMNATSPEADSTTIAAANSAANNVSGLDVAENYDGVASSQFKALPGFQVDTTDALPTLTDNVLTDSVGQVVLAVRGGSGTSYQGIFFITIQRSALSKYGIIPANASKTQYKEASASDVLSGGAYIANSPSLSDYYTVYTPNSTKYPTYTAGGVSSPLTTFVNFNKQQTEDFNKRSGIISSDIKSYNSALSTYQFQMLFEQGSISFLDSSLESELENFSSTKRQAGKDDAFTNWAKAWKEYAELLEAQEQARSQGEATKTGSLLSEVCAVGYGVADKSTLPDKALWEKGGACYYATK